MPIRNEGQSYWPAGTSGNPAGRPKGAKNRSTILKKWLDIDSIIKYPTTGKEITGTIEDSIALALLKTAMAGDEKAIREIYESVYGKAENTNKEFESELVVTISLDPCHRMKSKV
jgi:hypothetical protein